MRNGEAQVVHGGRPAEALAEATDLERVLHGIVPHRLPEYSVGSGAMAIGATIYTFAVQLADVDRGVYDDLTLRVARHPSETDAYMVTRVLAYCLEFEDGIAFSEGISTPDEPAVLVRDLTGRLTAWIEVGAPDAERLHYGSKLADRTVVYTHRDPVKVARSVGRQEDPRVRGDRALQLRSRVRRLGRGCPRAPQLDHAVDHRAPALRRS